MVRAVTLSYQVMGSKQPLRRFCGGEGLPRFFLSPDPTHVGASGTRSAPCGWGFLIIIMPWGGCSPGLRFVFLSTGFYEVLFSCHLMRDVKAAFTPYLRNSFCPRQASLIHVLWYVHGTCLVSIKINLVLQSRIVLSDSHCGSYNIMRWICIILYALKTFYINIR